MVPEALPDPFMLAVRQFSLINSEFAKAIPANDLANLKLSERECIYLQLSEYLLDPQWTKIVAEIFHHELLTLLSLSLDSTNPCELKGQKHVSLKHTVALATLLQTHPDAKRFVLNYFTNSPCPFNYDKIANPPKRKKTDKPDTSSEVAFIESCFTLLQHKPEFFKNNWRWSYFFREYSKHSNPEIRWLVGQCLAIYLGLNEKDLKYYLSQDLTKNEILECQLKYATLRSSLYNLRTISSQRDEPLYTSAHLVNIGGILLPVVKPSISKTKSDLVLVESTKSNLYKLALGIATTKAINLIGPVGSGKTTLVEYLAKSTGREVGENFIKVQLGDQTDSKMLLGTYCCTDVPGEFIWQPGLLTQAIMDGSWLLLEDIDSASMDIASVLSGLIENQYLTVPGFRDNIQIKTGFQLFVTQRLITTATGHHKRYSNTVNLLDKHVLNVNIQPLTNDELIEIISAIHPSLGTIASRMVDVFQRFTNHQEKARARRLASTRDFFKWCSRCIANFDVSSQESALNVLQHAIDIFCCSYPKLDERLALVQDVSSSLGIIGEKAKYFCLLYQPTIQITEVFLRPLRGEEKGTFLKVGRGALECHEVDKLQFDGNFCFTRASTCLLERIICCVNYKEPVLLVGETGTGKTSTVQFVANRIGQKLIVINMNQQSDSGDLLGGYKPVDMKFIIGPLKMQFEHAFCSFFNADANRKFLSNLNYCYNEKKFDLLLKLMRKSQEAALKRLKSQNPQIHPKPTKRTLDESISDEPLDSSEIRHREHYEIWCDIGERLSKLETQVKHKNSLAFAFIEGSLVKAIRQGYWVLLDEINLANAETLECLSGLLEGAKGTLSLLERGDRKPIPRHDDFMLFACMNPSTDVGKKDLPTGLRNRFTEFFVEELTDRNDLIKMVNKYFEAINLCNENIERIVKFYLNIRKESLTTLSDGLGHKPQFSLRSLCRALTIAAKNPCGTFKRSLYEAFCLSFLTQLDAVSYNKVEQMVRKYLIPEKLQNAILKETIPCPVQAELSKDATNQFLLFEGYWIEQGCLPPVNVENYILTPSVQKNLRDLARIVSIGKLPVLLQGETSVGKTSLITYLAKSAGYKCVRINNHEHTDLQEYIGSYVATVEGKLEFREGLLVESMRRGHWIILDELNLAPSDVLEALNRVLDDNRELYIPETQQTVKAHPNFMLFATQNPPGAYGGRKMLSRAFRNRFVELHFNEIPHTELEFILHKRCQMPESYARKMIGVMKDLQLRRRGSAAFAGKHGFITLRDLFRWGERYRLANVDQTFYDWDQHLTDEGYLLLAGRVRKISEREEIVAVLKKHMKRDVNVDHLFTPSEKSSTVTKAILAKLKENEDRHGHIVWTFNMRQLAVLAWKALEFHEPVLLVGDTGGGKTTVCDIIAKNMGRQLITVNCHLHTESSDFIGALRPVRDRNSTDDCKFFEWIYGPLVHAMQDGNLFLADEISLADDSVLERLNSLLEPERSLLISEKGCEGDELIKADERFHFIGTMNPGGDFGKKELSPALRNRFTEIWCETCVIREDLVHIIEHNLSSHKLERVGDKMMDFIEWFKRHEIGKRFTISIRDILTWVNFINTCSPSIGLHKAYLNGVSLTFLDSLGSGITSMESPKVLKCFEIECFRFILQQFDVQYMETTLQITLENERFGIEPFYISNGDEPIEALGFAFDAPTSCKNTLRLLRALQLKKALLLEGSPGVGKTSLVTALARASRNRIFRINLSDQTDISDLFGADLPVEGGQAGQFAWREGPLLQALKEGHWILLDELNLASQSVLEGLNACLDHRGEIFIPELGKTVYVKPGTRFFGCQNPLKQGGSRRGLPRSFLNRFTQVYFAALTDDDLLFILAQQFPSLESDALLTKMVEFNALVNDKLNSYSFGHKGAPWEFNLRDLTRWCEVMLFHQKENGQLQPENLLELIYSDRMRTSDDRDEMKRMFENVFGRRVAGVAPSCFVNDDWVYLGDVRLKRNVDACNLSVLKQDETSLVLREQLPVLRSLAYCVHMNWMAILVGGHCSGKSASVKTLAKLSGRPLRTLAVTSAMDTTDILGGFEQSDYTRHLDELAKDVEHLFLRFLRILWLQSPPEVGIECMQIFENFWAIFQEDTKASTSMTEETQHFLGKLKRLAAVLESTLWANEACLSEYKDEMKLLQQRTADLQMRVKRESSLNAGGKFEWVDSILVKCLKDGSWLLVDNVNLCSSAVLDRLNGLLEPNGVLTIGERGVDADGKMISVRPHPNFRLFLTMDPKNGEISRAMRNRGIEIFMSEKCSASGSLMDTKSLIAHQGLANATLIDILLDVHEFVGSIVLGETPTLSNLLHAAFLISEQVQRSAPICDAIECGILDVYVGQRAQTEFNVDDPRTLIVKRIRDLYSGMFKDDAEQQLVAYHTTLQTKALECNSQLALISQQASWLPQELQIQEHMDQSQFALIHFLTFANHEDLPLRLKYLQTHFEHLYDQYIHNNASNLDLEKWTKMQIHGLPLDQRWISDIEYANADISKCNKIFVHLYYAVYRATFECNIEHFTIRKKGGKSSRCDKGFTLLQYLVSVEQKKVDIKIDDPVLEHILHLCDAYDQLIPKLIDVHQAMHLSDEQTLSLLSLLEHRFQLRQCLNVRLVNVDEVADYIANIHIYYKWFVKHGFHGVLQLLRPLSDCAIVADAISQINSQLSGHFNLLKKLAKRYQKVGITKPPLVNMQQLHNLPKVHQLLDSFDLCNRKLNARELMPKLKIHFEALKAMRSNIERLEVVDDTLVSQGGHVEPSFSGELGMYTIFDYFQLLRILYQRNHLRNAWETSYDFALTIPIKLTTSLQEYQSNDDKQTLHEVLIEMHHYLRRAVALTGSLLKSDESEQVQRLEMHMPAFTYLVSAVFLQNSPPEHNLNDLTTLGNYRLTENIAANVNSAIWKNAKAFTHESFDYIANEKKFLLSLHKDFWKQLSQSLAIEELPIGEKLLQKCLGAIDNAFLPTKSNKRSVSEVKIFKELLLLVLENFEQLSNELTLDENTELNIIADNYISLNYTKLLLTSKLPSIDPLSKVTLKKAACKREKNLFSQLQQSCETINEIITGNDRSLHPHHSLAVRKCHHLDDAIHELDKYTAVRPPEAEYQKLVKLILGGFSTIFAPSKLLHGYKSMSLSMAELLTCDEMKNIDLTSFRQELRMALATTTSYDNFIDGIKEYQYSYPDLIEPLLSDLMGFMHGFSLKCSLFKKLIMIHEQPKQFNIENVLSALVKLPMVSTTWQSHLEMVNYYVGDEMHAWMEHCFRKDERVNANQESFNLLRCGLLEMHNICTLHSIHTRKLRKSLFEHFYKLLQRFVNAWRKQQRDIEAKKKDEEALYKMKTKCDAKSEEEEAAEELQTMFPSFKDFADITTEAKLDDSEVKTPEKRNQEMILDEDIERVLSLHTTLMLQHTHTEWRQPPKAQRTFLHLSTPFKEKFRLFKLLLDRNVEGLSYKLDQQLIGSLSVLVVIAQSYGEGRFMEEPGIQREKYNFYKDSNVDEVKVCYHLIKELEHRIDSLLCEWPDHPTLKTISIIIQRILHFSITSPLPRYLTGLDILLAKCHEWEQNAHSGVSLSMHFLAISQQLISWRKLEMANWKSSLERMHEKLENSMSKYWLYLHDIMQEFLQAKLENVGELISTLQQFISGSNIAEYQSRLRLLLVFHCHATYLDHSLARDIFISVLWNLHQYYKQFVPTIQQHIEEQCRSIGKKLKDYVKIVRWKDISYWALKDNMEKTHKIIHKFVREFEADLKQPAIKFMTNTTNSNIEQVPINKLRISAYITPMVIKNVQNVNSAFLRSVPNFLDKTKNLCKNIFTLSKHAELVDNLEDFISQVIATSEHLQSLTVDTCLEKRKQISQAKAHLQQKQRALSDLFKALTKIGLSFRKGIVENQQKTLECEYLIKPIDWSQLLTLFSFESDIQDSHRPIIELWTSVEKYYNKAFMRLKILDNALKTPSKDLGPQNIERCGGFTKHLMNVSILQKSQLVITANHYYNLRYIQMLFSDFAEGKTFVSADKMESLQDVLLTLLQTIDEYSVILQSVQGNCLIKDEIPVLTIPSDAEENCIEMKGDDKWNLAHHTLTTMRSKSEKLLTILQKSLICVNIPSTYHALTKPSYVCIMDIDSFNEDLNDLLSIMTLLSNVFTTMKIAAPIKLLITKIDYLQKSFKFHNDNQSNIRIRAIEYFQQDVRNTVKSLLLSIQTIAERYVNDLNRTENVQSEPKEELLKENHLTQLLVDKLFAELNCLNISKVCQQLNNLIGTIGRLNIENYSQYQKLLNYVNPFLDQVIKLYEFLVTAQINCYRISIKMCSILSNILINLATKGFCIPHELESDLKESDSKTSGGFGLGEGEGERDVSDRIESEDQLEDAQPAGQEKQPNDDKDVTEQEKGIEMSEDFDGKLQDVESKPENEKNESDNEEHNDSDAEEQMGDVDKCAEQLDKQIWGSDDDKDQEDEVADNKEESGKSGEDLGDKQLSAKENQATPDEDDTGQSEQADDEKRQQKKDINEMDDTEIDDNQMDPYHGNQPELPEPEPFDLPDDMQIDTDGELEEQENENPFDIDTLKEQMPDKVPEVNEPKDKDDQHKDEKADSSEDEDIANDTKEGTELNEENQNESEENETNEMKKDVENSNQDEAGNQENDETVYDQTQTQDNSAQPMDVDDVAAADNVEVSSNENRNTASNENACQEDNPNNEGVGQSQMDHSSTGHKGEANAQQNINKQQNEPEERKRNRPGKTDADRSLGDLNEPVNKRMKAMDLKSHMNDSEDEIEDDQTADIYKHIKEAKDSCTQVMDTVDEEQAEKMKEQQIPNNEDVDAPKVTESQDQLLPEIAEENSRDEIVEIKQKAEKVDNDMKQKVKENRSKGDNIAEGDEVEIEGEIIGTDSVLRSAETTFHTQYFINDETPYLGAEDLNKLRHEVEQQLSTWKAVPSSVEADKTWEKISSLTSPLAQELSEQLRLILEPTQASRLKGDFRTGRRINMRKVIPYIASQFRKDKIWLRRTKPFKRDYQIVLAIDDSSSMADNHSKELAFESVSLISKALTLLESGQLAILRFGEAIEIMHKLTDTFTEKSGSLLLQQLQFGQHKTCVAKLIDFANEMLNNTHGSGSNSILAKLLIIVGDGRGIFSEGESVIQQAVRRAKLDNVFMIFVVIDNSENKNSILDIRRPVFQAGNVLEINSYMDSFPIPFYIILRDINTLPSVLSDALRQWFELCSNVDRI